MKTQIYHGEDHIDIEYIFHKSENPSSVLVVSFPGAGGDTAGKMLGMTEWGYIVTLQKFNVNTLFLHLSSEYIYSRMTFRNHEPVIENAIIALVEKYSREYKVERTIVIGSSMGGWCSLYYGLKYNWDIISGSPPCDFLEESVRYSAGALGEENLKWLNQQLPLVISKAGKRGYWRKLFLSYGEGEPSWGSEQHGKKLIAELEKNHIPYELKLYPFSDHHSVYSLFPDILKLKLGEYLGLSFPTKKDEELSITGRQLKLWENECSLLVSLIKKRDTSKLPCSSIQGYVHYGSKDLWKALRNFVYVNNGWFFGKKDKIPVRMNSCDDYWRTATEKDYQWAISFQFQDELLNYFEQNADDNIWRWIEENVRQYLLWKNFIPAGKEGVIICRIHFFFAFYIVMKNTCRKCNFEKWITKAIDDDLIKLLKIHGYLSTLWKYRCILVLLHAALYYSNNEEVCNGIYKSSILLLKNCVDFDFDENGACISGQVRTQDILCNELNAIIEFIDTNKFKNDNGIKSLKRKQKKIRNVLSHMVRPDGIMSTLGSSIYEKSRSVSIKERLVGNLILRTSNIAFLEDENSISYITVNGGSNIHAPCKHSDLLSFTWYYDGRQIFFDAGNGLNECEEYSSSDIAHTAFICEDAKYVIPEYSDWTTIDSAKENETNVQLVMSHRLIEGVEMKRTLLWIKPNILILLDEATSKESHKFSQNFLMDDFKYDLGTGNRAVAHVAPEFNVLITQCNVGSEAVLQEYRGTDDANDNENFRGSLLPKQKVPSKALNLVYTKEGTNVSFLSIIECHSPSEKSLKEKTVKEIRRDENGLLNVKTVVWK